MNMFKSRCRLQDRMPIFRQPSLRLRIDVGTGTSGFGLNTTNLNRSRCFLSTTAPSSFSSTSTLSRVVRDTFSSPVYVPRYKLTFTTPISALSVCKAAVFSAGAGTHPASFYKNSCFETLGIGQFMPTDGANPHIGHVGHLERVEEVKVEVLCVGSDTVRKAIEALKEAHPYEECGYDAVKLENF